MNFYLKLIGWSEREHDLIVTVTEEDHPMYPLLVIVESVQIEYSAKQREIYPLMSDQNLWRRLVDRLEDVYGDTMIDVQYINMRQAA